MGTCPLRVRGRGSSPRRKAQCPRRLEAVSALLPSQEVSRSHREVPFPAARGRPEATEGRGTCLPPQGDSHVLRKLSGVCVCSEEGHTAPPPRQGRPWGNTCAPGQELGLWRPWGWCPEPRTEADPQCPSVSLDSVPPQHTRGEARRRAACRPAFSSSVARGCSAASPGAGALVSSPPGPLRRNPG